MAEIVTSSNGQAKTELAKALRLKQHYIAGSYGHSKWQVEAASRLGGPVWASPFQSGGYRTIWNGEKNVGEMGPPKVFVIDYDVLRTRSWQLYMESDVAKMIIGKYCTWGIGTGLKFQSEPVKRILQSAGLKVDKEFSKTIEAYWSTWAESRYSDYSRQQNLNMLAGEAYKNILAGGDVLVLLRYRKGNLSVQLIDGAHVKTPPDKIMFELFGQEMANGERVINGIHMSPRNEHLGYYVKKDSISTLDYEYIPVYGKKSGMRMAYMVYGERYRIDNHRGMPLLSVVAETIKKLERYKEATVASAEERAKIAYTINHKSYSSGENPMQKDLLNAFNLDGNPAAMPYDDLGNQLADRIKVTTNKEAWNMPVGAELDVLDSKNELHFNDFYTLNLAICCSATGIAPEVAMAKFGSNYSASRGAIKDWEHNLKVNRYKFAVQFYGPIIESWMDLAVMSGTIQAPGYMEAWYKDNYLILEAYRSCRWVGPPVPHIDPMKEVQAERLKLGLTGASLPLTTAEQATENLDGGDYDENSEQFSEELKESKALGIKPDPAELKPKPASNS